ncbi:hypothetical protein PVK06_021132 [Gossypium arboreum]|uniref:RNase H type-1 domain-containing protein n=1 Tax=Gossypium arboreum TaxID=29729 RepID=A0ABR0PP68_GOSAR|nr:hypothetical protein PVK06_021132 [Gossypium arboreum]
MPKLSRKFWSSFVLIPDIKLTHKRLMSTFHVVSMKIWVSQSAVFWVFRKFRDLGHYLGFLYFMRESLKAPFILWLTRCIVSIAPPHSDGEDIIHVLRACFVAREVWGQDLLPLGCDNIELAHVLQRDSPISTITALARRIQKLLQHKEFWVVKHILREANRVADRIAKMVCADVVGVNVMKTTPMRLLEEIVRDKSNGVFVIVRLT